MRTFCPRCGVSIDVAVELAYTEIRQGWLTVYFKQAQLEHTCDDLLPQPRRDRDARPG